MELTNLRTPFDVLWLLVLVDIQYIVAFSLFSVENMALFILSNTAIIYGLIAPSPMRSKKRD